VDDGMNAVVCMLLIQLHGRGNLLGAVLAGLNALGGAQLQRNVPLDSRPLNHTGFTTDV
jgi:hypothetical protein